MKQPKKQARKAKKPNPPWFWKTKEGQAILAAKRATADWSRMALYD